MSFLNKMQEKYAITSKSSRCLAGTDLVSKIPKKDFDRTVDYLFQTVSDVIEDGGWNKWTDIDIFFDAISDLVGEAHLENTLGTSRFPNNLPLSGKANSPALKKSVASKLKKLINLIKVKEDVGFPG